MPGFEVSMLSFWVVAIIICVILLALLGLVSHFCAKVIGEQREMEGNVIALAGQVKKLQSVLADLVAEEKRSGRQLHELLELKRAEMTGDFEVVEEAIPEPEPESPIRKIKGPELQPPPSQFPKL